MDQKKRAARGERWRGHVPPMYANGSNRVALSSSSSRKKISGSREKKTGWRKKKKHLFQEKKKFFFSNAPGRTSEPRQTVSQAQNVKQHVELMRGPEVFVGIPSHPLVGEDEDDHHYYP